MTTPTPTFDPSNISKHKFTFPPFPSPPPGVTIIPYKLFKERGIALAPRPDDPDETEVDALGIPTVIITKRHATDECKTNTRRKKEEDVVQAKERIREEVAKSNRTWWEVWEDDEYKRSTNAGVGGVVDPVDRLYQAAADFRSTRKWPPSKALIGIPELWDQFRKYIGIPANSIKTTGSSKKSNQPKVALEDELETGAISDDDFDAATNAADAGSDIIAENETMVDEEEPQLKPKPKKQKDMDPRELEETDEQRLRRFLTDPALSMKIYLSSYSRRKGFFWSEQNLKHIPILVSFFLSFLMRNRVFPSAPYTDPDSPYPTPTQLKEALNVVQEALKELPATRQIAVLSPDEFSVACKECWGVKGISGFRRVVIDDLEEEDNTAPPPPPPKIDEAEDTLMADPPTENTWASEGNENGWGNTASDGEWSTNNVWNISDPTDIDVMETIKAWGPKPPVFLLPFLGGPSVIPLTHTPGVVENSMRRIKSITLPVAVPAPAAAAAALDGEWAPSPEGVEEHLEECFAKVVMSPWHNWEAPHDMDHLRMPTILESSEGPVVALEDAAAADGSAPASTVAGTPKPHNPMKDDITLLVEPKMVEHLGVGIGIHGTWVQIARRRDLEAHAQAAAPEEVVALEGEAKKKKKSKKDKKALLRYWYLDELTMVIPSYWSVAPDERAPVV